jgi:hypothetical protein
VGGRFSNDFCTTEEIFTQRRRGAEGGEAEGGESREVIPAEAGTQDLMMATKACTHEGGGHKRGKQEGTTNLTNDTNGAGFLPGDPSDRGYAGKECNRKPANSSDASLALVVFAL